MTRFVPIVARACLGAVVVAAGCASFSTSPRLATLSEGEAPRAKQRFAAPGAIRQDEPTDGELAILERLRQRGMTGAESAEALLRAKEQADSLPELPSGSNQRDAGIWSWTWLGPSNIGGRARALAMDSSATTLWLGTAGGGIWRSRNGGASWHPLNDWLPCLSVSALLRDPVSGTLWAGTGEMTGSSAGWPGAGIFASNDDGDTWTPVTGTSSWKVARLAQASDRSYLLAATSLGLRRSVDGGQTWSQVGPNQLAVMDVECHPSNSNLAIAGNFGGGVLRTTDRGVTWIESTPFSDAERVELAYAPSQPMTVYASVNTNLGEIWRSTDGGVTFVCLLAISCG